MLKLVNCLYTYVRDIFISKPTYEEKIRVLYRPAVCELIDRHGYSKKLAIDKVYKTASLYNLDMCESQFKELMNRKVND